MEPSPSNAHSSPSYLQGVGGVEQKLQKKMSTDPENADAEPEDVAHMMARMALQKTMKKYSWAVQAKVACDASCTLITSLSPTLSPVQAENIRGEGKEGGRKGDMAVQDVETGAAKSPPPAVE